MPGVFVIRQLLLDLDLTLYPPQSGLMDEMNRRIERYVEKFLKVSPEEAERLRCGFRDRHGTTLRGLLVEHGADPQPFIRFVHEGLPGEYLQPDPVLGDALSRLTCPVHIFTNAPADYARRALEQLGLTQRVDRLFDLAFTDYWGKPHAQAYRMVEAALGVAPSECLLVDDSALNIQGARACGWSVCWMSYGRPVEEGLVSVESPSDLALRLPSLATAFTAKGCFA
jgi:putative hydrolase of the HAD superfamily